MLDFDWEVHAQLWQMNGPPAPENLWVLFGEGTLRECIGAFMANSPHDQVDLAITTKSYRMFRKHDVSMLARRADLGGWLKV